MATPIDYLSNGQQILVDYNTQTGELIIILPTIQTPKDRERARQACAEAVMQQWRIGKNNPMSAAVKSELAHGIVRVG